MPGRDPRNWMLAEAVEALARAERMQRHFFHLRSEADGREPAWEPPVDVFETEREILVYVALPGLDPDEVDTVLENGELVVSGRRLLPPDLGHAVIHRLELPHGRFERRIPLPPGRYAVQRAMWKGCLVFSLAKVR